MGDNALSDKKHYLQLPSRIILIVHTLLPLIELLGKVKVEVEVNNYFISFAENYVPLRIEATFLNLQNYYTLVGLLSFLPFEGSSYDFPFNWRSFEVLVVDSALIIPITGL